MRLRRPRFRGIAVPLVRRERVTFRLVLVGLASGALVVPVWWLTTQTVNGQRIADLVLYGQASADPDALALASQALGMVSLASAAAVTAGLVLVALPRGGVRLSLAVLATVGGANVTSQLLKRALDRPDLLGQLAYATGNSFPSGHVTLVASIGLVAILLAPRALRVPMALVASVSMAAVGVSAIGLAWHRLADVIGGMLIALAWASMVTALLVRLQGWMPRRTWARGQGGMVMGAAIALGVLALVAGGVVLVVGLVATDALSQAIAVAEAEPPAFLAALITVVGASLVASAAYVWAMHGVALRAP
jgi:membrane-associated phospholipid phosphatase